MTEKISIVVPVYNVENYLPRCIDSILAQTYQAFRLILIDDGSTDNSGSICDEYEQRYSCIHVIHQQNGGLSAARNAGLDWALANSTGEWISFVDSDDFVHPRYLESLFEAIKSNKVDVSICGFEETDGRLPMINERELKSTLWDPEEYMLSFAANDTNAWGKLYNRLCFKDVRYPVGRIHEDVFTTYKILFSQRKIAVVSQPLYAYYKNENSITRRSWSPQRIDLFDAMEEQIQYFHKNGFTHAEEYCVNRYLIIMSDYYFASKKYPKSKRQIKKRLLSELKNYRQNASMDTYLYARSSVDLFYRWRMKLKQMLTTKV